MPNLTSYTKATEATILASSPAADGEMAYSTDTNKLFLSDGTSWVEWHSDGFSRGSYSFDANTTVSVKPYRHIDLSDTAGMKNSSGSTPSNGDTISEITCKATGKKLTQDVSIYQPKFVSSAGTTPIAGTSHTDADTDALINGQSVLQFKNSKTDGQTFISEPTFGFGPNPVALKHLNVFIVFRNAGSNNNYPSIFGSPIMRTHNSGYSQNLYAFSDSSNSANGALNYFRFNNYKGDGATTAYAINGPVGYRYLLHHKHDITPTSMVAQTRYNNHASSNNQGDGNVIITNTSIHPQVLAGLSIAHGSYSASSNSWGGEMGELILFTSQLSDADTNAIGSYLSTKWGISYTDI